MLLWLLVGCKWNDGVQRVRIGPFALPFGCRFESLLGRAGVEVHCFHPGDRGGPRMLDASSGSLSRMVDAGFLQRKSICGRVELNSGGGQRTGPGRFAAFSLMSKDLISV